MITIKDRSWYFVLQFAARIMHQGAVQRSMWCSRPAPQSLAALVWC
jgi:hypothetical protein